MRARNLIVAFLAVGFLSCQLVIPTTEAAPTLSVQAYNVVGGGGSNDNDLNSTLESLGIWDAIDGGEGTGAVTIGTTTYNIENIHNDTDSVISYNNGTFSPNNAWSTIDSGAGLGGDDFSVRALATVTFQPGTYSIGTGSDDGRYLRLAGVTFDSFGGQGGTVQTAADTVMFNETTGHNYSVGTFTVAAATTATLDTHFFERGGGDSFNLAIKSGADTSVGGPGDGWELLQDGALSGAVSVDDAYTLPSPLETVARLSAWGGDVSGAAYVDNNGTAQPPASWTLQERGAPVTVPGLSETIWDGALPDGDVTGNIQNVRTAAAGPLGANDAQGTLIGHLHYQDDNAVSTRAAALGAVGFDNGNFTMLWTTNFTPNENGDWGFRNNNVDDRYSFWIDLNQDDTFQSDERFWERGNCCAGSGDRFISEAGSAIDALVSGESYLLGLVMNDTGGGGYFRDMEFKSPSGGWANLDPSATGDLFTTTMIPWTTVASGTNQVGDTLSDDLFLTMPLGEHYLRLTVDDGYGNLAVVEGNFNLVPEPSTFALAALGLLGLGWFVRRRKS